jgi:FAD/FMN-containing dehydrogenase
MSYENAFIRFREILDSERIIQKEEAHHMYGANTNASTRALGGALRPINKEEIQKILRIANEEHTPLYPISTGHNWGYGTALPVDDNNIILDLSLMNSILDFDKELGIITLEPGVTQQMLYDYLTKHNYPYLVPVTGAGPRGSIIGNALERGFGVTPISDHFSAITTISAVLADGTIYDSPLEEYGCARIDQLYRYGIGPYLDGMFTQSNFGVVTKMSIMLARKPEKTSIFFFSLSSHDELEEITDLLPKLLGTLGGITGGLKFVNHHQAEAMSSSNLHSHATSISMPAWIVTGGLFGDPLLVKAAQKVLKKSLSGKVHHLFFLDVRFFKNYGHLLSHLPLPRAIKASLKTLSLTFDLFLGKPSQAMLPVAYLGSGNFPKGKNGADPAKDGAGIIWFAPLIPMEGRLIVRYAKLVESTLEKYKLPQMVTFTSMNERCFDAPLAIVFNKNDPESTSSAKACYNELWEESLKLGIMPYRLPIDEHYRVTESGTPFWNTAKKLKDALDPNNIISPGRYSKK